MSLKKKKTILGNVMMVKEKAYRICFNLFKENIACKTNSWNIKI